ncbi:unnamed protein product [Orchesella dallaii]|uniref:E3 ubiquitin-protein ligase n=1 Tax=Orchesella dallaii TaxID=48710 RepID=A0ABP1Q7L8_9HEXA
MEGSAGPSSDAKPGAGASGGTSRNSTGEGSESECPVCLLPCMLPVQVPCGHVFCFMCIKGAVISQNNGCPMCRALIPATALINPVLKNPNELSNGVKMVNRREWYYQGRQGGWWQYDERTMQELERAFSQKLPTLQLTISGRCYTVDFSQMVQYRVDNGHIVYRRIKHGSNVGIKGVAGISIAESDPNNGENAGVPPPTANQPVPNPGPVTRSRRNRNATGISAPAAVP